MAKADMERRALFLAEGILCPKVRKRAIHSTTYCLEYRVQCEVVSSVYGGDGNRCQT